MQGLEPAARAALERLVRATQALHLALAPLPADAVFDLSRQLSGAEAPRLFSRRLARATRGNPFFLAEVRAHSRRPRAPPAGQAPGRP